MVDMATLYHGTTEEGHDAITESGKIRAPAFFTPDKSAAENYGEKVIKVRVPKHNLRVDFDLPGARTLPVDEANDYSGNHGWTIDDYLNNGHSVASSKDIPV